MNPLMDPLMDPFMDPLDEDILRRSHEYAARYQLLFNGRLGFGKDGTVWETDRLTAVKVFRRVERFEQEHSVYQRLMHNGVVDIVGFNVPQLESVNVALWTIEMTIVKPPFVLDFASAFLDGTAPVFPEDVMEEWLAEKK